MIPPSPYAARLRAIECRQTSIQVLGSSTAVWDYGPLDAPRTIVMIHGFRGDHHGLEPILAQLGRFRVIAPDLPGFGDSSPLGLPHTVENYARWLRELIASSELTGPVTVLGHSFGSIVVAAAVAQDEGSARGDSVVLVNPIGAPALSGPRGIVTRLAVFYYWLASVLPERLGFALLRNRLIVRLTSLAMVKTGDKALRRWIHHQHDEYFSAFADRRVVLEAFDASVRHDVSEFASAITLPVLLIAAERDDITSVESQHRLVRRFPNARLTVIDHVGHLIHYETPVAAADRIVAFLSEMEAL